MVSLPCTAVNAPGYAHRCIYQTIHKPGQRIGERGVNLRLIAPCVQSLINLIQLCFAGLLVTEKLNHLLPAQHFLYMPAQLALNLALFHKGFMRAAGDQCGDNQADRGQRYNDQRDPRVNGHHKAQRAQNGDYTREKLRESLEQTVS